MKFCRYSYLIILVPLFVSNISLAQVDSSTLDKNKLKLNPEFSGFQLEVVTLVAVNELGGLVDLDIYSSSNKHYNLGVRVSAEYYDYLNLDVGGGGGSSVPFLDYNIYARHTLRGSLFWFSALAGISAHTFNSEKSPVSPLFRIGFELKYNLTEYGVGIVLKGSKSLFEEDTAFLGIGLAFGFYSL